MAAKKPAKTAAKKPAPKAKSGGSLVATANRYQLFVEAFIGNGGNATQAAIAAGYSEKTAHSQGPRLLEHVEVRRLLAERQAVLRSTLEISTESVLRGLAQQSFFDVRRLFNADGSPKDISELDDDTAMAIAGLEVLEQWEGQGEKRQFVGYVKKYKLPNKGDNLERLARYLGLFERDNAQKSMGMLAGLPRDTLKLIVEHIRNMRAGGKP